MASPAVVWATAALLFAAFSTATPMVSFPINSQVPPVARIGQPFSFIFSSSTFTSISPITYSLSNPPGWLSLDSDARRLSGTPREEDVAPGGVVGVPLNLVATDDSGSTTLAATLVVSWSPGPEVDIPFEKQAPGFGAFSSPSSILSMPGKAFAFRLKPDTFSKPPNASISYYATTTDNTPLPAWISFDPVSLSFTGRTPPSESLVQPPERLSVQVMASDVAGFAGASLSFDIVVGTHQLAANETIVGLSATPGVPVSYKGLRKRVTVDGKPVVGQIAMVASTPNIPAWLWVDRDTWEVAGVPPVTAKSTNFTVTIRDTYSDMLNLTVAVNVTSDPAVLFSGTPSDFTVSPGTPFSFNLEPYLANPRDTEISVETVPSSQWIHFNSSAATLFGEAPKGLQDSAVNVKIEAKSKGTGKTAPLSFGFLIRTAPGSKGSTSTAVGPSPTRTQGDSSSLESGSFGNGRFNPMLLAVLLPLLLLIALGICALFWYFRHRLERRKPTISRRDISGPLPGSFVTKSAGASVPHSLPDFTKRFGKSFSADDVFRTEKKNYFESRSAFLTRPDLSQHLSAVRLLPPSSSSPGADAGPSREEEVAAPVLSREASGALRPETRFKASSSLSSITERSLGELVDSRGIDSVANGSRTSFRDKIEINVPRLPPQTPSSTNTGAPSTTEVMLTPRLGASVTAPDTDVMPLRAEFRVSYYPPPAAIRKVSWPWFKGAGDSRQGWRLIPRLKRLSEQPSVLTTDSIVSEKTSPQDKIDENEAPVRSPSLQPRAKSPTRSRSDSLPGSPGSPEVNSKNKPGQAQQRQV